MAETTSHETEMTRAEMAEYLRSIASEFDEESGTVRIPIGNKQVSLSPGEPIDAEATVVERSRRLRKDDEKLTLEFMWNPSKDAGSSSDDSGDGGA